MDNYDIIIKPVRSEKSFGELQAGNKKYTFVVNKAATKPQIKNAVEEIFGVKVESVNTVNVMGKVKRRGRTEGKRPDYKKAMVTLTASSKTIEFFDSLT